MPIRKLSNRLRVNLRGNELDLFAQTSLRGGFIKTTISAADAYRLMLYLEQNSKTLAAAYEQEQAQRQGQNE